MEQHVKIRLMLEKEDLENKIFNLTQFMRTTMFKELSEEQKTLLQLQESSMVSYFICLTRRISLL